MQKPDADGPCPIDLDAALEYVGGDQALLLELLAIFLEDSRVHLATIRAAFDARRAGEVMIAAHTVKGSLMVLGAATAASMAQRLELAGRASQLEGIELDVARFEEEMARLLQWAEAKLAAR